MVSKKDWFEDWFDETYLKLYSHRDDGEAARFIKWLKSETIFKEIQTVADLACGAGRHTWSIKEFTNWQVVGLDLSKSLLDVAIVEPDKFYNEEAPLFIRADIRQLPLHNESLDLALCMFTSFGYFETDAEHLSTLTEIKRILKPGGIAIIDLLNPSFTINNLVPFDSKSIDDLKIEQQRLYDPLTSRIVKTINIKDIKNNTRTVTESVRVFSPDDLKSLFEKCDLELIKFIGDYDGLTYSEERSSRLIAIIRKKP
jgi:ubiquinone/menaquinone biosynthesis C-methylase UbiE